MIVLSLAAVLGPILWGSEPRAHDLIAFDEIAHFTKTQFEYLSLWLRSTIPGQRCRIIASGNRPMSPEGLWVLTYWAPWLDRTHHDKAADGELRWPVPAKEGHDRELFLRSPEEAVAHLSTFRNPPRDQNGTILPPRSRTFIASTVQDNLDLLLNGYEGVLAHAPKHLQALAQGDFESASEDDPWQLIPTAWIEAAQRRWEKSPTVPRDVPMVAMGVDVAQGGGDRTIIAARYDAWYDRLIIVPGKETPNPSDVARLVLGARKGGAAIIIDCGGGYGGGVVEQLATHNLIKAVAYKGAAAAAGRSSCKKYQFYNKRAETWWRFREALSPEQQGGSPIALPPDREVLADLAAPRFKDTPRGIQLEEKAEIAKRLGRSPDAGDAVVLAWSEGQHAVRRGLGGSPGGISWVERPKYTSSSSKLSRLQAKWRGRK